MDSDEVLTDPITGDVVARLQPRDTGERPGAYRVHEAAEPAPQPLQAVIEQLEAARRDIGGLINRLDQVETTVKRTDRQVIMMAGTLALVLWTVKSIAARMPKLEVEVPDVASG